MTLLFVTTMATKSKDVLCGGYPVQFVGSLPKKLQAKCSICSLVLREPYRVSCCSYRFCKKCLDPLIVSRRCPSCSGRFSKATYDISLERNLNKRIVYCTRRSEGSPWTGELQSLENHKLYCLSKVITCALCKKFQGTDTEMKKHVKSCPESFVPCPNGCSSRILSKNVDRHIRKRCPFASAAHDPCSVYRFTPSEQKGHKESHQKQILMKGSSNSYVPKPSDQAKTARTKGSSKCSAHMKGSSRHSARGMTDFSEQNAKIQQKQGKGHFHDVFPDLLKVSECKHCKDFEAPQKKLKDHEKFCRSKRLSTSVPKSRDQSNLERCPNGCNARMRPDKIETHIRDRCPRTIVHCAYCNEYIAPRRKLKKHEGSCKSRMSSSKLESGSKCSHPSDFVSDSCIPAIWLEPAVDPMTSIIDTMEEELRLMSSNVERVERENSKLRSVNLALRKDVERLRQEIMYLKFTSAAKEQVIP